MALLSIESVRKEYFSRGKASKSLGYLINYNTSLFSTTGARGGIFILAVVVVVCNEGINRAESYLLRWRPREEKKTERELY